MKYIKKDLKEGRRASIRVLDEKAVFAVENDLTSTNLDDVCVEEN